MERTHVDSSQIESVGYDPATHVLEVEFVAKKDGTPGAVYQYENVSQEIADQLVSAKSVGKYFNQFVKWGFTYHKIEPPKPKVEAAEDASEPGPPDAA